jgi:hypothetical protein
MISLLLTAVMGAVLLMALLMRRRSPAVALAFALVSLVGTWFAWRPEDLNTLAHAVGVGRGADLALYLGLSLSFLALAALLLQLRHLQNRFTQLAREVALIQARQALPHHHAPDNVEPVSTMDTACSPPAPSKSCSP